VTSRAGQAHRWSVAGTDLNGDPSTMIFELVPVRRVVVVRPAGRTGNRFRLLVNTSSVRMLLRTLRERSACVVPASHSIYSDRVLGLRPHDPQWTERPPDAPRPLCAMQIYVTLPNADHRTFFHGESYDALLAVVTELYQILEGLRR
jgi:hypothetical protein